MKLEKMKKLATKRMLMIYAAAATLAAAGTGCCSTCVEEYGRNHQGTLDVINTTANVINAGANTTNAVFSGIRTFNRGGHRPARRVIIIERGRHR